MQREKKRTAEKGGIRINNEGSFTQKGGVYAGGWLGGRIL